MHKSAYNIFVSWWEAKAWKSGSDVVVYIDFDRYDNDGEHSQLSFLHNITLLCSSDGENADLDSDRFLRCTKIAQKLHFLRDFGILDRVNKIRWSIVWSRSLDHALENLRHYYVIT